MRYNRVLISKYLCGNSKFKLRSSHFLSLTGICIGVVSLLVVSAVMNGLRNDMIARIVETKADIRVFYKNKAAITNYGQVVDKIASDKDVIAISPIVVHELLLHKGERVAAVSCFGIDYDLHSKITGLDEQIRIGSPQAAGFTENGIIIGLDLSLSLNATVGEKLLVSSPSFSVPTPFGMIPQTKELRVVGIFVSGMPEYDNSFSYISLSNASFFSANSDNSVDKLLVRSKNPQKSRETAKRLRGLLGDGFTVEDWSVFDASLFEAMRLEKIVMMTVLALMLLITGFNMGGNTMRIITEKKPEIGILKAMGMKTEDLTKVFLLMNISIASIGLLIGIALSTTFIVLQSKFRFVSIPVPGFPVQWFPVSFRIEDYFMVTVIVFFIITLTTLMPLQKIKGIEPIKVIRGIK